MSEVAMYRIQHTLNKADSTGDGLPREVWRGGSLATAKEAFAKAVAERVKPDELIELMQLDPRQATRSGGSTYWTIVARDPEFSDDVRVHWVELDTAGPVVVPPGGEQIYEIRPRTVFRPDCLVVLVEPASIHPEAFAAASTDIAMEVLLIGQLVAQDVSLFEMRWSKYTVVDAHSRGEAGPDELPVRFARDRHIVSGGVSQVTFGLGWIGDGRTVVPGGYVQAVLRNGHRFDLRIEARFQGWAAS